VAWLRHVASGNRNLPYFALCQLHSRRIHARALLCGTLTIGSNGVLDAGAGDADYAFGPDGTLRSKFGVGIRPGIIAGLGVVALAVRNPT
jgi:hypothetical protein